MFAQLRQELLHPDVNPAMQDGCEGETERAAKRARTDALPPDPSPDPAASSPAAPAHQNGSSRLGVECGAGGDGGGDGVVPAPAAGVARGEPQAANGGTLWLEEGLAPPLAPERAAACYVCTLTAIPGR